MRGMQERIQDGCWLHACDYELKKKERLGVCLHAPPHSYLVSNLAELCRDWNDCPFFTV